MRNYEYIVASLPELTTGWKFGEKHPEDYMEEIIGLCSEKDRQTVGFLREGLEDINLTPEFYQRALESGNGFIREYFLFDLNVRNAKVRYLNKALGRPADKDVIALGPAEDNGRQEAAGHEFEEAGKVEGILNTTDILARERGLDDLMWEKIDSLLSFHYFDMTVILGFIAKLNIIARWYKLDEQTGREMFKRLVDEVRGTFKGVEYNG